MNSSCCNQCQSHKKEKTEKQCSKSTDEKCKCDVDVELNSRLPENVSFKCLKADRLFVSEPGKIGQKGDLLVQSKSGNNHPFSRLSLPRDGEGNANTCSYLSVADESGCLEWKDSSDQLRKLNITLDSETSTITLSQDVLIEKHMLSSDQEETQTVEILRDGQVIFTYPGFSDMIVYIDKKVSLKKNDTLRLVSSGTVNICLYYTKDNTNLTQLDTLSKHIFDKICLTSLPTDPSELAIGDLYIDDETDCIKVKRS